MIARLPRSATTTSGSPTAALCTMSYAAKLLKVRQVTGGLTGGSAHALKRYLKRLISRIEAAPREAYDGLARLDLQLFGQSGGFYMWCASPEHVDDKKFFANSRQQQHPIGCRNGAKF
jgi:hypothetical protein